MLRVIAALLSLAAASVGWGQSQPELSRVLHFETAHAGDCPAGWYCNPPETVAADDHMVRSGKWSVRLERNVESPGPFSRISDTIPIDFAGKIIELRGFIRSEDVHNFAGLWMREDGEAGSLASASMEEKNPVSGDTPWTEYSISVPVIPQAKTLVFGFQLTGAGKAWADDLSLLVDGKPVWDAPRAQEQKTPLDSDHEFDVGSRIGLKELSAQQVANVATLGRVWGFLKYYHPAVIDGQRQFDYDLFRILPAVLKARDKSEANAAILRWVDELGKVTPCSQCATLKVDGLYLKPDLSWLSDEALLGLDLSQTLRTVLSQRAVRTSQFYVSVVAGSGNASFDHELVYKDVHFPDSGYQILALFRFWNMIEYWSPNREAMEEDWPRVLSEFLPKVALAKDRQAYETSLMELVARVHDSHAGLWKSLLDYPPGGTCVVPVGIRFLANQAVVAGYPSGDAEHNSGLQLGDVIQKVDGVLVSDLVKQWSPYYGASNEAALLRNIALSLTRGDCGKVVALRLLRNGQSSNVNTVRVPFDEVKDSMTKHDVAGDTFQLLSKDIAYLKLSSVKESDAKQYLDAAAGTKGWIIDIRNYPSEFVVFALGQHFVERPVSFATFAIPDLSNPGAFHWDEEESLTPAEPRYRGKLVILVDESTQSSAEYAAMAFRAAPNAIVMGSTTAGADGNVSQIPFPGGFSTLISGIGVFYPNKKPTQRVGIVPDVRVVPTIAGIRDKRDEVLEAAMHYIESGH